jgi:hypothetical protein
LSSYQFFVLDVLSKLFILSNVSEYEYNQKSFMNSNKGRKMHTFPFDKQLVNHPIRINELFKLIRNRKFNSIRLLIDCLRFIFNW